MKTVSTRHIPTVLCTLVLAACGSSGGSSATPSAAATDTPINQATTTASTLTPQQLAAKQEAANRFNDYYLGVGSILSYKDDDTGETVNVTSLDVTINGKTYQGKAYKNVNNFLTPININDFKQGLSSGDFQVALKESDGYTQTDKGTYKIYNQPFSFAAGLYNSQIQLADGTSETDDYRQTVYGGVAATVLPSDTTVRYKGSAFNKNESGSLEYEIAYKANNTGSGKGKITGMSSFGDITLAQGDITSLDKSFQNLETAATQTNSEFGIRGTATFADSSTGSYELGIYGPNATEIAGKVETSKTYIDANGDSAADIIGFVGAK